jgi:hypothetical protein
MGKEATHSWTVTGDLLRLGNLAGCKSLGDEVPISFSVSLSSVKSVSILIKLVASSNGSSVVRIWQISGSADVGELVLKFASEFGATFNEIIGGFDFGKGGGISSFELLGLFIVMSLLQIGNSNYIKCYKIINLFKNTKFHMLL